VIFWEEIRKLTETTGRGHSRIRVPWSNIANATTRTCIAADLAARPSPGWPQPIRESLHLCDGMSAHLFAERGKGTDAVREDRLDSPRHGHLHLAWIVDGPNADLLPGFPALLQELLSLGAHEQRKVYREAVTRVPKVGSDDVGREADMIAAEQREVVVCSSQEQRVPDAEDESRREKGLPRGVFAEGEGGRPLRGRELTL